MYFPPQPLLSDQLRRGIEKDDGGLRSPERTYSKSSDQFIILHPSWQLRGMKAKMRMQTVNLMLVIGQTFSHKIMV